MSDRTTPLAPRLDRVAAVNLTSLAMALALAQTFYKFGSFAPEALAFLATWWTLSQLGARLARVRPGRWPFGAGA
jgi:hypothetical protein